MRTAIYPGSFDPLTNAPGCDSARVKLLTASSWPLPKTWQQPLFTLDDGRAREKSRETFAER